MLKMKVLDLNELIVKDEKMLKRLIREDIRFTTDLEPGLCSVMADAVQMNQILINLAVNAQDAMAAGGEIRVCTRNRVLDEAFARQHPLVKPGSYVELSVADTGHGMDQELIGRIFEPFFTTKEKGKGTGLGLATVYGIIKQHDGHIVVESEVDRGATFKDLPEPAGGAAPGHPERHVHRAEGQRARAHPGGGGQRLGAQERRACAG